MIDIRHEILGLRPIGEDWSTHQSIDLQTVTHPLVYKYCYSKCETYMNVSGHPKVRRIYNFVGAWVAVLCQLSLKNTKGSGPTLILPWHVFRPIHCQNLV